jgi:hypothetical protein
MLALLGLRPDKYFQKKKKKKRKPFPLEAKGKAVKVFGKKMMVRLISDIRVMIDSKI